jgi:RNA polymerase sigma factor (sigma-70 family)
MITDAELLDRYATDGSEAAFTELVRRNIGLVYGAVLRHVGDTHRAKDITQTVFIDLARKAGSLRRHPALLSWLYTSARFAALKTIRSEQRRQAREQEAQTMQTLYSSDPTPDWEQIRPTIEEVMQDVGERDREVLLLRYFRELPFAELAAELQVNEGAARMRVDRALERMNRLLTQRGIKSTAAALGLALSSQFATAAPAGLAAHVSGAALSAALGTSAVGTFFIMSKLNIALVSLVVVGGIATAIVEHHRSQETQATLAALAKDRAALERKVSDLNRLMAEARDREFATARGSANRPAEPAPAPVAVEPPPAIPGVSQVAPAGWSQNGSKPKSYVVGVDQNESWGGLPSAYVQNIDASSDGFGGMMQATSADEFLGRRVRLSGWVKTEDANDGGGHLWLRVDGQQRGVSLQFDNMDNRPIKGTTEWQQYSVVLDVPPDSTALAYGFFVQGRGKMWVNGTKMEPVGAEVPSTNMIKDRTASLPKTPRNLNFDPNQPR